MELGAAARRAGFSLEFREVVASTNDLALACLRQGGDRHWFVAGQQQAGRGRHGRDWVSPPGNLYASLALAAPCPPARAPLVGFVAGLSLAEALCRVSPALKPAIHLKWPNDVQIAGAKAAGILLEGLSLPGGRTGIVIGMGANIRHRPDLADYPVTALADHAPGAQVPAVFAALSDRIAENLALFDAGNGFAAIREGWLRHALPPGTKLRVRLPAGERHGTFAGLDPDGHLLLDTGRAVEAVMVGDVFLSETPADPQTALRTLG
ncbi:MAG: biotin--[acetyl-CoA-carboxylase] ligase [Beijerinckiaceae bacterium]|nr:biotin--[acetyl-CoA-carboxylase] ligase [Beijerinckiaceae bacterium]